jgi:hypothetical protein
MLSKSSNLRPSVQSAEKISAFSIVALVATALSARNKKGKLITILEKIFSA